MLAPLYVVTGAPGAGKTTLLAGLAELGHRVLPEAARELLAEDSRRGIPVEASRSDEQEFQRRVLQRKVETERALGRKVSTFLDRGIPDTVAFWRLHGWPLPAGLDDLVRRCKYDAVFMLEALPRVSHDYARTETVVERARVERLLWETYESLDAVILPIPMASIRERVAKVLAHVNQVGT